MVGIVGILLLGSLAWSAVGALFAGLGEAAAAITSGAPPPPKLSLSAPAASPHAAPKPGEAPEPPTSVATPTLVGRPTPQPTLGPTPTEAASVQATPSPTSSASATPTPSASGRSPWILLPGPAPDSRVAPGPQVIEARGRGDSPITVIRLELDGTPLDVTLEQRSESVWRGSSSAQVAAGHHVARATVVDDQGRTGSFRWTFEAGP